MATPTDTEATARAVRGRPREFDREQVLDALVEVFWREGYEATSMTDIVAATGLNKSSLYNAFGGKDDLFHAAVDRYVDVRGGMVLDLLRHGTAGLDDVLALLDFQETEARSERGEMGCLAVNTSTELGRRDDESSDMVRRFRTMLREALGQAFGRAEERGEIAPGSGAGYVETLVAFSMSLAVIARGGGTADELDAQFAAMRSLVESWRLAPAD